MLTVTASPVHGGIGLGRCILQLYLDAVDGLRLKALLFRDTENGENSRNRELNTEFTILGK